MYILKWPHRCPDLYFEISYTQRIEIRRGIAKTGDPNIRQYLLNLGYIEVPEVKVEESVKREDVPSPVIQGADSRTPVVGRCKKG